MWHSWCSQFLEKEFGSINPWPHFDKASFNSYLTSCGQKSPILDILDIVVLTLEIGIKVCDLWNYDLIWLIIDVYN